MNDTELMRLMGDLLSPDECDLDHHGHCQSHNWFGDGECDQVRLRRLLNEDALTLTAIPAEFSGLIDPRNEIWHEKVCVGNDVFRGYCRNELRRTVSDLSYKLHQTVSMATRMLRELDAGTIQPRGGFPTLTTNGLDAERLVEKLAALTSVMAHYAAAHQDRDEATH